MSEHGSTPLDAAPAPLDPVPAQAHEADPIDAHRVVMLGIGLVVIVGVVMALVSWIVVFFGTRQYTGPATGPPAEARSTPPAPRLQVSPVLDLKTLRETEERMLNHYEWVDQKSGVVRIPIDRAIEVLAEKGLPARPQPAEPGKEPRK